MFTLKKSIMFVMVLFTIAVVSLIIAEEIPHKISFQGKLLENGTAVTDSVTITFSIDDYWSETHNVNVINGFYSVTLGSDTPIPDSIFINNSSAVLHISVEGVNLEPDTEILSSPYAFKAEKSADADKLGGQNPEYYASLPITSEDIEDGIIVNADISNSANISAEKIEDAFLRNTGDTFTGTLQGGTFSGTHIGNGSELTNLDADLLDGRDTGTSPGNIAFYDDSNGRVYDSDKLDGHQWSDVPNSSDYIDEGQPSGGDLTETYPNPTVAKIQGRPVSSSSPSTGEVLKWTGSQWAPEVDNTGGDQNLEQTLENGNSAGSYSIDMDDEDITDVGNISMIEDGQIDVTGNNGILRLNDAARIWFKNSDDDGMLGVGGNDDGYDQVDFKFHDAGWIGFWDGNDCNAYLSRWGDLSIQGDLDVVGSKNFIEEHPKNSSKEIVYSCLEGGEVGTYCRGTGTLNKGKTTVLLPDHFGMVTSSKGITAQVTPQGNCNGIYIKSLSTKKLVVEELNSGTSDVNFYYFVQGIRNGYENHKVIRDKNSRNHVIKGVKDYNMAPLSRR